MSAISYTETGHDFNNQPPHDVPTYLSARAQTIYGIIQTNLVEQIKTDTSGNGYLAFRSDSESTIIDAQVSVLKLTEAIELALGGDSD